MGHGQVKRLAKHGNSLAMVIDRPILDILGIDEETDLRISTDGKKLIIEPLSEQERQARLSKIIKKTGKANAELFKRLAR